MGDMTRITFKKEHLAVLKIDDRGKTFSRIILNSGALNGIYKEVKPMASNCARCFTVINLVLTVAL